MKLALALALVLALGLPLTGCFRITPQVRWAAASLPAEREFFLKKAMDYETLIRLSQEVPAILDDNDVDWRDQAAGIPQASK
jgi:hypothetical protein